MNNSLTFAKKAVNSFDTVFSTIFEQANLEANRVSKLGQVLEMVEAAVLDEETIAEMLPEERLHFLEIITRNRAISIKMLLEMSRVLGNVRRIAGQHANLSTALEDGENTLLDDEDVYGSLPPPPTS